jgi:hypothetical protein
MTPGATSCSGTLPVSETGSLYKKRWFVKTPLTIALAALVSMKF